MNVTTCAATGRMLNICILARKKLYRNTRVVRQAKALSEAGHEVTVVAIELPAPELRAMTPRVTYILVLLEPWPEKVLRAIFRIFSMPGRAIRKLFYSFWNLVGLEDIFQVRSMRRINGQKTIGWFLVSTLLLPITACRVLFRLLQRVKTYLRKGILPFMDNARNLSFAAEAEAALNGQHYDYVQAHDSYALLAAWRVAHRKGAKLIYDAVEISEHRSGNALRGTPNWLRRWQVRRDERIIRTADLIFTIGPALAEWTAERYCVETPIVVRNCSLYQDPNSFNSRIRGDLGIREDERLGIFIGNMYLGCGIEQLIESMKYLKPEIHLAVLGVETQRGYVDNLRELVIEENMDGRFHILSPQPPHNVIPYSTGADFGVIALQKTSLNHECVLPNKVFEMIMARLPVASSTLPNLKALLEEYGIGMVFNEEKPQDIARTINAILEPESYSRYQKAVSVAAKELCWEREGERYLMAILERAVRK